MHILLTDRLICPRCGPGFGLILLADRLEDRRVVEGRLGCSNCREEYPIRDGVADLRFPPEPPQPAVADEAPDPEATATRLAALLGLTHGGGMILVAGRRTRLAPAIAALVEEIEVVAVDPNLAAAGERSGVSAIAAKGFPVASRSMRGVALAGGGALLDEGMRVVAPGGRIVVEYSAPGTADYLRESGFQVLFDQEGVVVASPRREK